MFIVQEQSNSPVTEMDEGAIPQGGDSEEMVEIIETAPKRRLLNTLLWVLVALIIIGFAVFGVTTLQHHAPMPPEKFGAIYHAIAYTSASLLD